VFAERGFMSVNWTVASCSKPGESRTVSSLEPQICLSQLTNPSVHTVSAAARAGTAVLARATDTYITLPPA
jgi:hypothetical protein